MFSHPWRRRIQYGVLLLCMLALGVIPADSRGVKAVMAGDEAFRAGRYWDAIQAYQRAQAWHPRSPEVSLRLARALLARRETEPAQAILAHIYTTAPAHLRADIAAALGEGWNQRQDAELARYWWERALALDATHREALWGLARLDEEAGRLDDAAARLRILTEAHPYDGEVRYRLGLLELCRDGASGTSYLEELLHADIPLWSERAGAVLQALGGTDADAFGLAARGVALLGAGEPRLAAECLTKALAREPDYADAWAYLGVAQAQSGRPARPAFDKALALDPDNFLAHYFLGRYHLHFGLGWAAMQEFERASALDPDNPALMVDMAIASALEGDYAAAGAWIEKSAQLAPDDAELALARARFFVERIYQLGERGLPAAREAVRLNPDSGAAYDLLGWAYFLAGAPQEALEVLQLAVEKEPTYAPAFAHLGAVLFSLGDVEGGRAAFQHAIDLDPAGKIGEWARKQLD